MNVGMFRAGEKSQQIGEHFNLCQKVSYKLQKMIQIWDTHVHDSIWGRGKKYVRGENSGWWGLVRQIKFAYNFAQKLNKILIEVWIFCLGIRDEWLSLHYWNTI